MISSKLTAKYFLLSVALACLVMDIEHSFAEETLHDFAVDFSYGTTLSDEEINSVTELAYLAGFGEISSIRTVPMPPTSDYMIHVREKSTDDEPYSRYRMLSVGSEKLFSQRSQSFSRESAKSNGGVIIDGFWEVGIRSVTYFPTDFNGKNVEIKVDEGINRDDLLRILNALKNDRVESLFNDTDFVWSSAERGLPTYISLSPYIEGLGQPDYVISYGDSGSTYFYDVLLEENKLVILTVGQLTA